MTFTKKEKIRIILAFAFKDTLGGDFKASKALLMVQ